MDENVLDDIFKNHNCTTCKQHGTCALESPLEFIRLYGDEVAHAVKDSEDIIKAIVSNLGMPLILDNSPAMMALCLGTMAEMLVAYGYSKGRSHVEIPSAFEKGMKG
mgnify:CR=1 FL=1